MFTFRQALKIGLIYGGSLFLFVLLPAEIYLRVKNIGAPEKEEIKKLAQMDPFLQNRLSSLDTELHVNQQGYRGDELSGPSASPIVFLGGSTVLAAEVYFEKSHPRLLEKKLRAKYGDFIQVLNAGNQWHTSQHSVIKYLFRIRHLRPRAVVIWHGINDLYRSCQHPELTRGPYKKDYSHFYGAAARVYFEHAKNNDKKIGSPVIFNFALANRLLDFFKEKKDPRKASFPEQDFPAKKFKSVHSFSKNMRLLVKLLQQDRVPVLLATQAHRYRPNLTEVESEGFWLRTLCQWGGRNP